MNLRKQNGLLENNFTGSKILRNIVFPWYIHVVENMPGWGRILVQVTIYRRLLIGRDGHLDRSEAYDLS